MPCNWRDWGKRRGERRVTFLCFLGKWIKLCESSYQVVSSLPLTSSLGLLPSSVAALGADPKPRNAFWSRQAMGGTVFAWGQGVKGVETESSLKICSLFKLLFKLMCFLNLFFLIYFLMIFLAFLATFSEMNRLSQINSPLFVKTMFTSV